MSFFHVPIYVPYTAVKFRDLPLYKYVLSSLFLVFHSYCLLFLVWHSWCLSKPSSSSQIPFWLLHEIFPNLSHISPPEVTYSFSKFTHNLYLSVTRAVTRVYRDVYKSYLCMRWQAFWGQKPHCIQFCDVHCLMWNRYLVNKKQNDHYAFY